VQRVVPPRQPGERRRIRADDAEQDLSAGGLSRRRRRERDHEERQGHDAEPPPHPAVDNTNRRV